MNRIFAIILILLTFPLLLLIATLISMKYPGPFFYRQTRGGKNGKPFKIIKLRTMVVNASEVLQRMIDEDPAVAKKWEMFGWLEDDPRIVGQLGRIARKLSIDELPQLINVLKGEMAFIGPRPLEIPSLEALNPDTRILRDSVLPGITGLAQVENRSATLREMQFYDRILIRNQTPGVKIYIIYKTFFAVFGRTGA